MKFKFRQLGIIMAVLGMALLVVSFFFVTEESIFSHIWNPHTDFWHSPEPEPSPTQGDMPPVSFNDKPNREKSRQLRFELERDCAWAEVDCCVKDRFGNPISNADIQFYFNTKENRPESEGFVMGKTDKNGCFSARHKTTYACHWRIQKEGYYESRGILPFSNHFSWKEGRKGR